MVEAEAEALPPLLLVTPCDAKRRRFRLKRPRPQRRRVGLDAVPIVELGQGAVHQHVRRGEPRIGILGRLAGHRQHASNQGAQRLVAEVG